MMCFVLYLLVLWLVVGQCFHHLSHLPSCLRLVWFHLWAALFLAWAYLQLFVLKWRGAIEVLEEMFYFYCYGSAETLNMQGLEMLRGTCPTICLHLSILTAYGSCGLSTSLPHSAVVPLPLLAPMYIALYS